MREEKYLKMTMIRGNKGKRKNGIVNTVANVKARVKAWMRDVEGIKLA